MRENMNEIKCYVVNCIKGKPMFCNLDHPDYWNDTKKKRTYRNIASDLKYLNIHGITGTRIR